LFQDVLASERADGRRILYQDETAVAFVPYFARYAYETYIAPLRTHASIAALDDEELAGLARALKHVLVCYDNLWKMPFPYVLVLHQAPTDDRSHPEYHFHVEIHPPLRKPNLLKYLAGPEIGGGSFVSDTAPEATAQELRAAAGAHYRSGT
jgi:UDPglucose--hexose-1-phosphate uridylyltransferase